MLSRHKSPEPAAPEPAAGASTAPGKGRPTPRRSQAEAARKRPLVPADRKVAAKTEREAAKAARDREYRALQTGDERYLPPRDKGPVRRFIRDYVDARRSVSEFFLPATLVVALASFLSGRSAVLSLATVILMFLLIGAVIADAVLLRVGLKRRLTAKFGRAQAGSAAYAILRSTQMRRTRRPPPKVKRGEKPV